MKKNFILVGILACSMTIGWIIPQYIRASESNIYVATNGSDTKGDGSLQKPYKTLYKASTIAKSGYTIYIRGGTYNTAKEKISTKGVEGNPITIKPYQTEKVIYDGTNKAIGSSDNIIKISDSQNVVLEGIEVRNSKGRGISVYNSTNVVVRNNIIHDIDYKGIGITGDSITIENNKVYNAVLSNKNQAFGGGGWSGVIGTWVKPDGTECKNITISGNEVYNSWGEGILPVYADNVKITKNKVYNTFSVLLYLDKCKNVNVEKNSFYVSSDVYNRKNSDGTTRRAHGILFAVEEGSGPNITTENIKIGNNLILGVNKGIGFWYDSSNTTKANSYRNILIVYNVIKNQQNYIFSFDRVPEENEQPTNINVINSIFYNGEGNKSVKIENQQGWSFSHNDWVNGIPQIAQDSNSLAVDPEFVGTGSDFEADGYKLQDTSELIGKGIFNSEIIDDYFGKQRNINSTMGIYEK